jgi:hypothetical protein
MIVKDSHLLYESCVLFLKSAIEREDTESILFWSGQVYKREAKDVLTIIEERQNEVELLAFAVIDDLFELIRKENSNEYQ